MSKEKDTQQMSLLVDSHVNHSQSQEKESQQQMIVTSGMKCLESLEKQSQDGLLEKMLKALLISTKAWYSDRCLMTWKTKVSKANVLLFQLQASVLGIKEKESGLSPTTYPTPTRGMYKQDVKDNGEYARRIKEKGHQIMLPAFVKLYPTPRARDYFPPVNPNQVQMNEQGWTSTRKKTGVRYGATLPDVMNKIAVEMYPTPRASAAMVENMETIAKRNKYNSKLEEKVAMKMFPTPATRDYKDSTLSSSHQNRNSDSLPVKMMKEGKPGGKLNPNFVEFLMGFPMNWTKIDPTE